MDEHPPRRMTMMSESSSTIARPDTGLSLIGMLTPIDRTMHPSQERIDDELTIGRGKARDGIQLTLNDQNASRRHAIIRRIGSRFLLEDLGSSNGTFLNDVPIRWAQIHDGDKIRCGRTTFYFDHTYEFAVHQPSDEGPISINDGLISQTGQEVMTVRFWGTRGSLPTPGSPTRKFGGNTTCAEVRYGDTLIVIDAGSGIRELSRAWGAEFHAQSLDINLLLTHLHWDHIQGFPFFLPAYQESNQIHIYGPPSKAENIQALLKGQMQGTFFPIPFSAMTARLDFSAAEQTFTIGDIHIETFPLPHPGGSLGYRFTAGDSVFVFATDSELDQVALNRDELKLNHFASRQYDPVLTEWMRGADLLVIDCQYTDDEYLGKIGWGHNSISTIVDLCQQVHPRKIGLTHHDPMSTDPMVTGRVDVARNRLAENGVEDVLVFGVREQLCMDVSTSVMPIAAKDESDVTLR